MTARTCILCKHIRWRESWGCCESDYGEADVSCDKGHIKNSLNMLQSTEEYREMMLTANGCKDYEEIDAPPVANGNFQIPS